MEFLTRLNARLSRWTLVLACVCLAVLLSVVVYGVVLRYGFNDAPAYVEQLALLLVISVAMFGAAAGVRDAGHIGLDSVVRLLPSALQRTCHYVVHLLVIVFALALMVGSWLMARSTGDSTIPTLGISEAYRYLPVIIAGILITLFSIERMVALFTGKEVVASWN